MNKSILAAVLAAGCALAGDSVKLADGGKPLAKIVVAKDADKAARFAAKELKYHLDAITGGDFAVITDDVAAEGLEICVGPTSRAKYTRDDFKPQEWLVDISNERIVLAGRDEENKGDFTLEYDTPDGVDGKGWPDFYSEQGSMYAVYNFLERECGVIWADAEDDGTVIRKNADLAVAIGSRREEPFIFYRGGSSTGAPRYDQSVFKWGTPRFNEYRKLAYSHPKTIRQQNQLFLLRHRVGGRLANANHSFYHYYNEFWKTNSPSFVKFRPELFAKGYPGKEPPQMCYGSQEFVDQVVKDIRAYFDQDPKTGKFGWGRDNYCLEGMDNSSFCLCDICKPQYEPERAIDNGRESTYWFRFVKRVADEIAKSHPGKQISTLAYHSHEALPNGVTLPKNVVVYFCLYANRMSYAKVFIDQMDRIRRWREAYPDQPMALWLYNTFPKGNANNAGFDFYPAFFAEDAYSQYQFFKKNNIRAGIFQCGLNGAADTYMQLEWMINPDRAPEELLDEYFSCYGKPGKFLKEFYRVVERRYEDKSLYPKGGIMHQSAYLAWGVLGTKELMEQLADLMAKAESVAETPAEKRRLAVWKYGIWEYMKGGFDAYQKRQSVMKPKWSAKKIAAADGEIAKVDWNALEAVPFSFYNSNSEKEATAKGTVRMAHDGQWFYLELAEGCETAKLVVSPQIFCVDTWELFIAGQEALPYRHYYSGPDGRIGASSNGEVNWRQNVPATESGPAAYGAKCVSDRSDPGKWVQRFAFRLDNLIDHPLKPGDTFYANFVRVVCQALRFNGDNYIQTVVPCSTVHTTDRLGSILLED